MQHRSVRPTTTRSTRWCAASTASALRLATVVLGTRDGADDVVQIAMQRAWSSFGRYDAGRPFKPWFLRIVANTARNDRRQRGRRAQLRQRAERERARPPASVEDDVMAVLDRPRSWPRSTSSTPRTGR